MRNRIKAVFLVAYSLLASASMAGPVEDGIRKVIEPRMGIPAVKIVKSPFAGLYEVDTARGLVYTDSTGSFLLFNGVFVDTKSGENLSQKREDQLGVFKFSELPLQDAIKTVYGDGSRVLVTIEDPNCGYCKRLVPELAKLSNVTVYTFLYPVLGPDSEVKAKAIWCAADRAKTWHEWMSAGQALPAKTDCANPIDRNVALATKLRVRGTPTILLRSGERIPGLPTAEQLAQKLAGAK
jgi:thiol:disulfide interchange protein DsbC